MIAYDFSGGVAKRSIISKTELECFYEETDLGISALMFMKCLETSEERISCFACISAVNVGSGDVSENEGREGIIILSPDIVRIRGDRAVRARNVTIQPGAQATLTDGEGKHPAPLKPVGFAEIKNEIGGPGCILHRAFSDADTVRESSRGGTRGD